MNYYVRKITTLLFTLLIVATLSGCGSSLQKPSGLEEAQNQQVAFDKKESSQISVESDEQVKDAEVNHVENKEVREIAQADDDTVANQQDKVESSTNDQTLGETSGPSEQKRKSHQKVHQQTNRVIRTQ